MGQMTRTDWKTEWGGRREDGANERDGQHGQKKKQIGEAYKSLKDGDKQKRRTKSWAKERRGWVDKRLWRIRRKGARQENGDDEEDGRDGQENEVKKIIGIDRK